MPSKATELGEWIAKLSYEDIPPEVVAKARLLALDTIGVGMFGLGMPWSQRLLQTVRDMEAPAAPGGARVWGSGERFSTPSAAMVNSTASHGFELDDYGASGHSGCVVIPVLLATTEQFGAIDGREFIVAMVAAIEVQSRVGEATGGVPAGAMHSGMGFHGPGLVGTFSAAVAAARALRLDPPQIVDALGHAGQQAASLMFTHHGGMGKRLLAGQAARSGTFSALLARAGFTNSDAVFEAEFGGFLAAHTGNQQPRAYFPEELTAELGSLWHTNGASFKVWACRAPIHATLEAIKVLRQEHPFETGDVVSVDIKVGRTVSQNVGWPYVPATTATAQLNMQYAVSALLAEGDVFVDQFTRDKLASPLMLSLVERVHPTYDPEFIEQDLGDSVVRITLADGTVLEHEGIQRGGMDVHRTWNHVTHDEVVAKFRKVTRYFWDSARQDRLIDLCDRLPSLEDTTVLLDELTVDDVGFLDNVGLVI